MTTDLTQIKNLIKSKKLKGRKPYVIKKYIELK